MRCVNRRLTALAMVELANSAMAALLHKEMVVLLRAALAPVLETKIILLRLCFL